MPWWEPPEPDPMGMPAVDSYKGFMNTPCLALACLKKSGVEDLLQSHLSNLQMRSCELSHLWLKPGLDLYVCIHTGAHQGACALLQP